MAETRSGAPDREPRKIAATAKQHDSQSITPATDNPAHDVPMAATRALTALVVEVRPDLPWTLAESYVLEALDRAAGEILDVAWAQAREHLYPEAVSAARAAKVGPSYSQRRANELRDARPKRGDYPGRRHLHSVRGGAA